MKKYPLVVIVGETASGKTDLSIALAKKFNGEIISADSVSIRRELNIGSSKPTVFDRSEVTHHLIDVIDPDEKFSVSQYKILANKEIKNIIEKKKLPILVGGSGLYINSILYNYKFRSNSNQQYTRSYLESLNNEALEDIARKHKLDLSGIDVKNNRRLIRYIETGDQNKGDTSMRDNTLVIGLYNTDDQKKERIQTRVHKMIKEGLETEVKQLYSKYGSSSEIFKIIGYKEWLPYLENEETLDDVILNIIKNTNYLAKKQKTWFKSNNSIQWFNYSYENTKIVEVVTSFISEGHFN